MLACCRTQDWQLLIAGFCASLSNCAFWVNGICVSMCLYTIAESCLYHSSYTMHKRYTHTPQPRAILSV